MNTDKTLATLTLNDKYKEKERYISEIISHDLEYITIQQAVDYAAIGMREELKRLPYLLLKSKYFLIGKDEDDEV